MGQQCCHSPPSGHGTPPSSHNVTQSSDWRGTDKSLKSSSISPSGASPSLEVQDEAWEINYNDLEFTETTGKDYFGTSWKGKWKNAVEVEIKTMALDKENTRERLKEVELLRGLRHPNLLNVVGVCTEKHQVHVVTELPSSASSLQQWMMRGGGRLGLPLQLHILAQAASGMAYLEERDFLLFDVAARNVLMTSDLVCKLPVFGLAKRCQDVRIEDLPLSFTRMVPDTLTSGGLSMKSSVWAFAVFMLEVVKDGQLHIHDSTSNQEVMQQVKKGHGFPPPDNCPQDLCKLMKKCWVLPPEKRPTFATLRDSLQDHAAGYTQEDLAMFLQTL